MMMMMMMMTTIPSWETVFTATHRLHPDHRKTRTLTLLLLPRVYKCHATTVVLLFAMVRIYYFNQPFRRCAAHLVFHGVTSHLLLANLIYCGRPTYTYYFLLLSTIYIYNPKDAIGVTNSKPITKLGFAIDVMHFTAGGVTKWINVKTVVKLFVTLAQH